METAAVIEHVERIVAVRAAGDEAGRSELEAALGSVGVVGVVGAWLAGAKATLTSQLAPRVSFPEQTIVDCTRGSTRDAINDTARADTLAATPGLADALEDARVTAGHVDAVTRATKSMAGDVKSCSTASIIDWSTSLLR